MAKKKDSKAASSKSKEKTWCIPSTSKLLFMMLRGIVVVSVIFGAYLLYVSSSPFNAAQSTFDSVIGKLLYTEVELDTFEMAIQESDLIPKVTKALPTEQHTLGTNRILYTPCLLVSVKYNKNGRTTETADMVWDMIEGELILSLNNFSETSGFYDCMRSKASLEDFRVLHTLSSHGGSMTKEALIRESGVDNEATDNVIDSLWKRHLVTITNDMVRLHVKTPFFRVAPETKMSRPIVQKRVRAGNMTAEVFSQWQIETLIQSAYGKDIAIMDSKYIWIPVWGVDIVNPDGSMRRMFWNAITGKEVGLRTSQALTQYMK